MTDAIQDVNRLVDSNNLSYARKSMIRFNLALGIDGTWSINQLFFHLQEIIEKHFSYSRFRSARDNKLFLSYVKLPCIQLYSFKIINFIFLQSHFSTLLSSSLLSNTIISFVKKSEISNAHNFCKNSPNWTVLNFFDIYRRCRCQKI